MLLEDAGPHQIIGRHAPDIGLVALTDFIERERRTGVQQAERQSAGGGETRPAGHSHRRELTPQQCRELLPSPLWGGQGVPFLGGGRERRQSIVTIARHPPPPTPPPEGGGRA